MTRLGVIGNIAIDRSVHPDGSRRESLGGAALYVALAASRHRLPAFPISVIGADLDHIRGDPRMTSLDLSGVKTATTGRSATFTLTYQPDGDLARVESATGAASGLTAHAMAHIANHPDVAYHVCCRRPLDVGAVLAELVGRGAQFSVDFFLASAREAIAAAAPMLPRARTVFVNAAEHELLAAATRTEELPMVLVSDGPRPARLFHHGRHVASCLPPRAAVREPTGAGDTLAGTFLAAQDAGMPADTALQQAVITASAHVTRAQSPLRAC